MVSGPGTFITLEGIDGAGKTTQIEYLRSWLYQRGGEPLALREPGGTVLGERVRGLLLQNATPVTAVAEALLYAAARAQMVEEVLEPALAEGRTVICDRFLDSSIAYQGYGRGLGQELVEEINRAGTRKLRPHLTLFLDVSVAEALRRKRITAGSGDRLEVEEDAFFQRVRRGYWALARQEPQRFVVIPASGSGDEVWQRLVAAVERALQTRA